MSEKRSILGDTIKYSGGQFLGNSVNAVRGLLVAHLLGPALFSVWKSLQLILFYSKFSQFGSLSYMIRQVPFLRGQEKHEEVEKIENTAFAGNLIFAVVVVIGLLAFIQFHNWEEMSFNSSGFVSITAGDEGYFVFADDNGETFYTRDGGLKLDTRGMITGTNGLILQPLISVPSQNGRIWILPDGEVRQDTGGGSESVLGRIQPVRFENKESLAAADAYHFSETGESGRPLTIEAVELSADRTVRKGLYYIAVLIILMQIYIFYYYYLSAERLFGLLSRLVFGYPVILMLFQVALVYFLGIDGVFLGLIIANILIIIDVCRRAPLRPKLKFKFAELWKLVCGGFPVMIVEAMFIVLRYIDRVILVAVVGAGELLGNYFMAAMLTEFFWYIPTAFGQVVNTRMIQVYGRDETLDSIKKYFNTAVRIFAWGNPLLIGCFYCLIPIPLAVLSQYWTAVGPSRILILMIFFLSMLNFQRDFFIATKTQWKMLINYLVTIPCIFYAGWIAANRSESPTMAMAFVLTVFSAVFISVNYVLILRMFSVGLIGILRYLAVQYWPFAYMLGLLAGLSYMFGERISPEAINWYAVSGMTGLFVLLYFPVMLALLKYSGLSPDELNAMLRKK